jgi:hypothetical protein
MGLISADDRVEGSRNVLKQMRNNASSSAINIGSIGNSAASYSHSVGANTIDLEKKRVYKIMKFKKEQELKKRIMVGAALRLPVRATERPPDISY